MRKEIANYGRMTDEGYRLMKQWGLAGERGHIKIRPVKCGKEKCKTCPHAWYAYHRNSYYGKKYHHRNSYYGEKYLGTCNEDGSPRERYE